MISASDLSGLMAMMPAFATPDAANIEAEKTIDVGNLRDGVNRMISDGASVIATTGSYGEFHTLLWEEFQTLARATIETVNKRIPLFIGCTSLNSREVVRKMRVVQEAGGEGVLLGVPGYFPSSVENAVRFYHDVAELFPKLAIMIYHNPELHRVHIPVAAFSSIMQSPNIVAAKDDARSPTQMIQLVNVTHGRLSIFVHQNSYYAAAKFGAVGCWSIESWMGPWPVLRLIDAVKSGDDEQARALTMELIGNDDNSDLRWRETARKIAAGYAGYCQPGPLRPPFVEIPPAVIERTKARAAYWKQMCARYQPQLVTAG